MASATQKDSAISQAVVIIVRIAQQVAVTILALPIAQQLTYYEHSIYIRHNSISGCYLQSGCIHSNCIMVYSKKVKVVKVVKVVKLSLTLLDKLIFL